MNTVPALGLITDPTHESPDVIDQRPATDPTRQQTSGNVPSVTTPGAALPVLVDDSNPQAPILNGWNVWDVYQSQAPIDPLPGSLDDQLAAWVRSAANLPADAPIAEVDNAAAGQVLVTRSSFPSLAVPLLLGVDGSEILKRTIAFQSSNPRLSVPWPHDMNNVLDAVYLPAPAPPSAPGTDPIPSPNTTPPAPVLPRPHHDGHGPGIMLAVGVAGLVLGLVQLRRGSR